MQPTVRTRAQLDSLDPTVSYLCSRYPVTVATLAAVGIVTLATQTYKQGLSRVWQNRLGVLGLVCATLPAPWGTPSIGGVMSMLMTLAARSPEHGKHGALQVQADIAHLLASSLGVMSSRYHRIG